MPPFDDGECNWNLNGKNVFVEKSSFPPRSEIKMHPVDDGTMRQIALYCVVLYVWTVLQVNTDYMDDHNTVCWQRYGWNGASGGWRNVIWVIYRLHKYHITCYRSDTYMGLGTRYTYDTYDSRQISHSLKYCMIIINQGSMLLMTIVFSTDIDSFRLNIPNLKLQ